MEINYQIKLKDGGLIYPSTLLKPDILRALLARGYEAGGYAICQCQQGTKQAVLRIKRRGQGRRHQDLYYLTRMPGTASDHAGDCCWHIPSASKSGQRAYQRSVISWSGDTAKISLRFAPEIKGAEIPREEDAKKQRDPRTGKARPYKSRMTELGLLHLLWEMSGVYQWHPNFAKRRNWWVVADLLKKAASDITWTKSSLSSQLAVITPGHMESVTRFRRVMRHAIKENQRIVVIGELYDWLESHEKYSRILFKFGRMSYPAGFFAGPSLPQQWQERYPAAYKALKERASHYDALSEQEREEHRQALAAGELDEEEYLRVVALLVIEPRVSQNPKFKHKYPYICDVRDGALMLLNRQFMPFDSSYELALLQNLIQEGRFFRKPLRFDADSEEVFPDFVLFDTGSSKGTPLEVFGMNTEEYIQRKAEKISYYNREYGVDRWWCWYAADDPKNIPPLPKKVVSSFSAYGQDRRSDGDIDTNGEQADTKGKKEKVFPTNSMQANSPKTRRSSKQAAKSAYSSKRKRRSSSYKNTTGYTQTTRGKSSKSKPSPRQSTGVQGTGR